MIDTVEFEDWKFELEVRDKIEMQAFIDMINLIGNFLRLKMSSDEIKEYFKDKAPSDDIRYLIWGIRVILLERKVPSQNWLKWAPKFCGRYYGEQYRIKAKKGAISFGISAGLTLIGSIFMLLFGQMGLPWVFYLFYYIAAIFLVISMNMLFIGLGKHLMGNPYFLGYLRFKIYLSEPRPELPDEAPKTIHKDQNVQSSELGKGKKIFELEKNESAKDNRDEKQIDPAE